MKKKRTISIFFAILLWAVLLCSGYMIWKELAEQEKDKDNFATLVEIVEHDEEPQEEDTNTAEEENGDGRNLSALFAKNDECIGWISIPDTAVNYPVMHTPNNPEKYLRRNFYNEYSQSGTPFLDGRCSTDSTNLILFGHNMRNGTMFSAVTGYAKKGYAAAHPVIELETADGLDLYTVYAAVSVKNTDSWYSFIYCSKEDDFNSALAKMTEKAYYKTEIVPQYGDRLLTLSTCYGNNKNDRIIIIAVKQ